MRWLVDGLLPSGGLSPFAAKPKVGKSTLTRALCASVVCPDGTWLGAPTLHGPAVYLGLEEKRTEVKRHFEALGVADGAPLFVFTGMLPADAMEQIEASVRRENAVLLVVDGLFRLLRLRDGNASAEVVARLDPVSTWRGVPDATLH